MKSRAYTCDYIHLYTNDGEKLATKVVDLPLPKYHVYEGRMFKRLIGPENYYIEVIAGREWKQSVPR